eukprot:TRINITY_DN9810_c1_g1_i1.p1 TRINITY_DN9810_c1_g1~~TRINITY_DN9810_c1_g1_i1.p1  ORF type:complete len:361 (+),score=64.06 TRINITY_DN9810_c1_g1_i1:95-1177(+)
MRITSLCLLSTLVVQSLAAEVSVKRIQKKRSADRSGIHFDAEGNIVRVEYRSLGEISGIGVGMKVIETNGKKLNGKSIAEYIESHIETDLTVTSHCYSYRDYESECDTRSDCTWKDGECAPISVTHNGVSYTDLTRAAADPHQEGSLHTSIITTSFESDLHNQLLVDDALSITYVDPTSEFSRTGIKKGMRLITLMGERVYSRRQVEELLTSPPKLFMVVAELFCTAHTDQLDCLGECEWIADSCVAISITESDIATSSETVAESAKPKVHLVLVIVLVLTTFSILGMILYSVHLRTADEFQQVPTQQPASWKRKALPVDDPNNGGEGFGRKPSDDAPRFDVSSPRRVSFSAECAQVCVI